MPRLMTTPAQEAALSNHISPDQLHLEKRAVQHLENGRHR